MRPVAEAGFGQGCLETRRVTWADTERGRGPTGTAVRTGRPCAASWGREGGLPGNGYGRVRMRSMKVASDWCSTAEFFRSTLDMRATM